MNCVALQSKNLGLQNYARMQCIKRTSTVRISGKVNKPIPKIIFQYGKQNGQTRKFLVTRKFVLDFLKRKNK